MDYAHRGSLSLEEWRQRGRAEVKRTLSYFPQPVPLDLKIESITKRQGYEIRVVSFAGAPYYRIPAYLLIPEGTGRHPAVVALHDHGGWFVHGKEKLVQMEGEHPALKLFRSQYYSGRAYAEDLARQGFVVLVPDAFYWGERRLTYRQPPLELLKRLEGLKPEQVEYVAAMNQWLRDQVSELNTWLSFSGTSWLGIVAHDDRRAVDLLASLAEVDPQRIGCIGLSGGGYRATYLTGLDPRIKASVIVGWMSSLPGIVDMDHAVHAGLFDSFGLHANLDHPDVASLAAPQCAVFVQQCARDQLFTRKTMQSACDKLRLIYEDTDNLDRFRSQFYDVPHQFNAEMQQDAYGWLKKWLDEPPGGDQTPVRK